MSTPSSEGPVPNGWDFPLDFLATPAYLPPYVPRVPIPVFGTSRRAQAHDVADWLVPLPGERADTSPDTAAVLSSVHAIVDDTRRRRHDLVAGSLVLRPDLLHRHLLVVGPPGVGKTTQVMLPLILALLRNLRRTVVVFDPKGDQFPLLRKLAVRSGRPRSSIVRLDLTDPDGSIGWNPLRRGLTRTDALAVATALVMSSEAKNPVDSPFWRNSAMELLVEILLGLCGDPDETLTLPRVLEIVNLPRPALLAWLRGHGAHKFAAFLESGSHNAETCLADVGMRLLALFDRDLCAVLSHDELDLQRLFQRPMVLVVEMNEARIDRLRPIFNLLVQQLLDLAIEVTERRADARLPFPASLVIDEFGSAIGAIPRFPVHLNTLRSRGVGIVAAVQSTSQIRALYGHEAGAVLGGFSSKIWFPNVDHDDAETASRGSGTMTVALPAQDGHVQHVPRRVFLPEEIAQPPEHPILGRPVTIRFADQRTVQAYLPPMYRLRHFRVRLPNGNRKPRRRVPLVYRPHTPLGASDRFLDTTGMARSAVLAHLNLVEHRIRLAAANDAARDFWTRWRDGSGLRLPGVLRIAEELLHRGSSVQDYYDARCRHDSDDPEVNLRYLDYLLALRRAQPRQREG